MRRAWTPQPTSPRTGEAAIAAARAYLEGRGQK